MEATLDAGKEQSSGSRIQLGKRWGRQHLRRNLAVGVVGGAGQTALVQLGVGDKGLPQGREIGKTLIAANTLNYVQ